MQLLKVFCSDDGKFGDSTAIILDEDNKLNPSERQVIAANSGLDEVAFIDNVSSGQISIYNPLQEVAFAGQIVVGAAWFWRNVLKKPLEQIVCRDFTVDVGSDEKSAWTLAPVNQMPPWDIIYEEDLQKLEKMSQLEAGHAMIWSWLDRKKGEVRARTFAPDWGIPEAEVNGSGSILLAHEIGRKLVVRHGLGSTINVEPIDDEFCRLSGFVVKS